ncbi:hypothetical protein ACJX0J_010240, partial [Zea mays]
AENSTNIVKHVFIKQIFLNNLYVYKEFHRRIDADLLEIMEISQTECDMLIANIQEIAVLKITQPKLVEDHVHISEYILTMIHKLFHTTQLPHTVLQSLYLHMASFNNFFWHTGLLGEITGAAAHAIAYLGGASLLNA